MKKRLRFLTAILASVGLIATLAAGCSSGSEEAAETTAAAASNEEAAETEAEAASEDPLRVVLLITSNLGDQGFYDSANDGVKLIEQELGAEVQTIEMGQDPSQYEPYIRDVAEQDWDYIIIGSSPAVDVVTQLVPEYPDKKFIMFDTEIDWSAGDFSNLYCVMYKQNEASYLAGAVASILTTEGERANPEKVIGAVGGGDNPTINDFLIGYIEGAQHIDPETKIAVSYAGTFIDSTKGKELGLAQMNSQGVDVCFQIASQTGIGVLDAAKDTGVYAIGVDGDQAAAFEESDPDMSAVITTSVMKRVDQSLLRAVQMAEEGTLPWGTTEVIGLKEQGVGIVYDGNLTEDLSAENLQLVKDIEQQIIDGEIVVSSALDMETAEFQEILNSVAP